MPLAVNDIVQVIPLQEKDNQVVLNVFYYRCRVAPSSGTVAENILSLLQHLWLVPTGLLWDKYADVMADSWTFRGARGQKIAPTREAYVEMPDIGGGTVDPAGLNVSNLAWVIVKQSELAGRRGKGTLHLNLSSSDWIDSGRLAAAGNAVRVALRDFLDDAVTPAGGGEYDPVIYHPGFSPNYSRITHCTIKDTIRVMRRRTVGQGI